jgi:hypothetical protein
MSRVRELPRRAVRGILSVAVALYLGAGALLGPVVQPAIRALAATRAMERLRGALLALGPHQALVCLAVPVLVIEPLKLVAMALVAHGDIVSGIGLLVVLHIASLLVTERLFAVLEPALMRIGWFALVWTEVVLVRDRVLTVVRGTALYKSARGLAHSIVAAWRRVRASRPM